MNLADCYNTADFRRLARRRLPAPVFHYIDGGADDELTLRRNTDAFEQVDLVPNVLAGINEVDLRCSVLGQELAMPLIFSPTAMQRLFHPDGETAIARVASELGTYCGLSTMGTVSIETMAETAPGPKLFQIYVHRDPGLTSELIARCRASGFNAMALTVDTIVAGNRERDYRTGMTTPPKLTPRSLASFALHPSWSLGMLRQGRLGMPNVNQFIQQRGTSSSVVEYINRHLRTSIRWDDAARMIEEWGGPFAIKGVMSVEDARRCVEIGATAIFLSNHGGRQLDGSRTPFDQLSEVLDAVGGKIEVIVDGGIRRGTHVLKAMAAGATACSGGRFYLYALGAAGTAGVRRAAELIRDELERDMMLMGCETLQDLDASMLARSIGSR